VTGGTTGTPRQVCYTRERYAESVRVSREILRGHGVGRRSAVLVCFPSDPWAIGGVFRDAALACGARVLSLGLSAGDGGFAELVADFRPTVLCGSADLLAYWGETVLAAALPPRERPAVVFHAGEPLRATARARCAAAWRARVIDVYGMAEFDSVASEGPLGAGLVLSPHLYYALSVARDIAPLDAGLEGELLIRRSDMEPWHPTRDVVRVLGRNGPGERLWPGSWIIEHRHRADAALKLPDGSTVSTGPIRALALRFPEIEQWQLQVRRAPAGPAALRLLAVPTAGVAAPDREELAASFLTLCAEVADAVKHRAVTFEATLVEGAALARTTRGKVKHLVEVE
jgi:phenylacetate-coenzyme A ligase PaaK-like adenylate-forming protein